MSTRADYREWLRLRLGVKTPLEAWTQAVDLDWDHTPLPPQAGAQPDNQIEPSNYKLNSAIVSAANRVTRECRFSDALNFTDINVPSQTAVGPYTLRLDTLPGFPENGVVRVRRSYWYTGTVADGNPTPVYPALLGQLDAQIDNYLTNGPATPYQIAIEGMLLYLLPGPESAGILRLTVGSGALAPLTDSEGYDGIPEAYTDCVNYIALLELASIMPNDTEMTRRAKDFQDDAAQSMLSLMAWTDNEALDEFQPGSNYRSNITRYSRRN